MPRKALPLVRTSERLTYTSCLQKWWWAYVEQLAPKVASPPLRFGTLIHAALEARYPPGIKRGPHPAKTFERLYEEEAKVAFDFGFKDSDGAWTEAFDLGVAMLNGYVEEFGEDEEWEVIGSELQFKVPVRGTNGKRMCYAVGTLDSVWRNRRTKKIWLNDYKTAKSIWDRFLVLDEQASAYWVFAPPFLRRAGHLAPGEEIEGMLFTFLRKAYPDDRPRNEAGLYLNKDGSVSKVQPPPLFKRVPAYRTERDREAALGRFRLQVEEMIERRQTGRIFKAPGKQTCAMCSFRDMCELHEFGADWEAYRDSEMGPWEPYGEHEIESEGK